MATDLHFRCFYAGNYREAYLGANRHGNLTIPNWLRERAYFGGGQSTATVSRSQHSKIA
jgi:hypothetical protein